MRKPVWIIIVLVLYIAFLFKLMVFKDVFLIRIGHLRLNFGGTQDGPPNLIPFKSIWSYLHGDKGLLIGGINIVGNIVLLMPIGFLIPFLIRNMTWKKSLVIALASGLAIEGTQAILHVGIFDTDDLILNGLGVMMGYWGYQFLSKRRESRKEVNRIGK